MKETFNNKENAFSVAARFISSAFYCTAILLIFLIFGFMIFGFYLFKLNSALPDIGQIKNMSARGAISISYPEIPEFLKKIVVSAYDPSFFEHRGLKLDDLKSSIIKIYNGENFEFTDKTITRHLAALALNKKHGGPIESNNLSVRIRTLLEESLLAFKIESKIKSKNKILEIYLNNVSFSKEIAGLLQSSVVYFNKRPQELDESDCITLAAMMKINCESGCEFKQAALASARKELLKTLIEKGVIDKNKAENYNFEELNLNSYRSKINKFFESNFMIINL